MKIFLLAICCLYFFTTPVLSDNIRKIYCPYCGAKIENSDSYCPNCTMATHRIFTRMKLYRNLKNNSENSLRSIKPILNNRLSKDSMIIVKELINRSKKSIKEGKYHGCENFARAVLKIDQNSYIAYYLIAQSYFERKDYKNSMKNIVESLKINPLYGKSIRFGKKLIKVLNLR